MCPSGHLSLSLRAFVCPFFFSFLAEPARLVAASDDPLRGRWKYMITVETRRVEGWGPPGRTVTEARDETPGLSCVLLFPSASHSHSCVGPARHCHGFDCCQPDLPAQVAKACDTHMSKMHHSNHLARVLGRQVYAPLIVAFWRRGFNNDPVWSINRVFRTIMS